MDFKLNFKYQCGFRLQRDTIDPLLHLTEDIYEGFFKQVVTIATIIDFESAIDRVSPASLLLRAQKLD